jgi:lipid-binding SYLF domain-containing protein
MRTRSESNAEWPPRRLILAGGAAAALCARSAHAASRRELEQDAQIALQRLYASEPKAAQLGARARAVLVFPKIVKAGFMVGGQTGNGVLFEGGKATRYYNISAGSFGLQAGAQVYGYALFFITQSALDYLRKSQGWAVGSGPSIVVLDQGKAKTMNTTTLTQDVYAMAFGQQGLMAGLGLEGSKISEIHPQA